MSLTLTVPVFLSTHCTVKILQERTGRLTHTQRNNWPKTGLGGDAGSSVVWNIHWVCRWCLDSNWPKEHISHLCLHQISESVFTNTSTSPTLVQFAVSAMLCERLYHIFCSPPVPVSVQRIEHFPFFCDDSILGGGMYLFHFYFDPCCPFIQMAEVVDPTLGQWSS